MSNRVALVTGSSRGIGRAIAQRLAAQGIAVCINYRERREEGEQVARSITGSGGRVVAIRADLTNAEDCAELVRQAEQQLGPIDILVNNAGVLRRGDLLDFVHHVLRTRHRCGVRQLHVDQQIALVLLGDETSRRPCKAPPGEGQQSTVDQQHHEADA